MVLLVPTGGRRGADGVPTMVTVAAIILSNMLFMIIKIARWYSHRTEPRPRLPQPAAHARRAPAAPHCANPARCCRFLPRDATILTGTIRGRSPCATGSALDDSSTRRNFKRRYRRATRFEEWRCTHAARGRAVCHTAAAAEARRNLRPRPHLRPLRLTVCCAGVGSRLTSAPAVDRRPRGAGRVRNRHDCV